METPTTLLQAVAFFSDPECAFQYAVKLRWPNGVACPRVGCGSAAVQFISTRKLWRCKDCKRQFSVKVGTIFEDSPIPFTKWLPAIWLLANTKNGTSSWELHRALGVTQKTAWFMFHRIREAMKTDDGAAFTGEVEADETFVGGKTRTNYFSKSGFRKLKHGPATGKTTVFGMVQRSEQKKKSRVRAFVVPNHKASVLLPKIYSNVKSRIGSLHRRLAFVSPSGSGLRSCVRRSFDHLRRRSRAYELHRELLVVPQAHNQGDVHRPAPVPPRPLP